MPFPLLASVGRAVASTAGRAAFAYGGEAGLMKGTQTAGAGLQMWSGKLNEATQRTQAGTQALNQWGDSLRKFRNQAGRATAELFVLRGAFEGMSGKAVGALTGAASTIDAIANPLKEIVGLARPV